MKKYQPKHFRKLERKANSIEFLKKSVSWLKEFFRKENISKRKEKRKVFFKKAGIICEKIWNVVQVFLVIIAVSSFLAIFAAMLAGMNPEFRENMPYLYAITDKICMGIIYILELFSDFIDAVGPYMQI